MSEVKSLRGKGKQDYIKLNHESFKSDVLSDLVLNFYLLPDLVSTRSIHFFSRAHEYLQHHIKLHCCACTT
jgi:hypothetical protein